MSSTQERIFIRVLLVLIIFSLLWIIFIPDAGLLYFLGRRAQLERLEVEIAVLEKENAALKKDIHMLINDPLVLEKVAREKYQFLKKGEILYDFSKDKSGKKQ